MRFFDTDRWNEIWQTISRNRKRSIMTALGVFWGIFMLIVLLGAGMGLGRLFRAQLGGMSTNTVLLQSSRTSVPYKGMPTGRWWRMDNDDLEAVSKLEEVEYTSGVIWGNELHCSYKERKGDYQMMGYTPDYQKINPQKIIAGRYINEVDMVHKRKVCVIGTQVQKDLFPGEPDPTGKVIKVGGSYFTIIGVMRRESSAMSFSDVERTVVVPISLAQQMFGYGRTIHLLALAGYKDVPSKQVEKAAREAVFARHMISPDDEKAAWTMSAGEMFDKVMSLFWGIGLLTWIVGLGTLLAGIVGVSNIMLVLVKERTQEIGIRRALGAPPTAIISQILSESFILTFIAGILGLTAAVGVLSVVDSVYYQAVTVAQEGFEVSWQISFGTGMLALFFAALLLGTFWFLWQKTRPVKVVYTIVQPKLDTLKQYVVATGKVEPRDEVLIKPQISGIVSDVYKEAGQMVRKGEVIATVKVVPEMGQLSSAESRVSVAEISLDQTRREFDRTEALHKKGVVSDEEYEQGRTALRKAQEELQNAKENMEIVKNGITSRYKELSNTQIRSTIDGMILDVPVKVGNSVIQSNTFNDGTTIATVADMSNMLFRGNVDETDVGKLHETMPVKLTIGALQNVELDALLEYVSPKATEDNGVIMFEVKAAVKIPENVFVRAGYSANASIVIQSREGVLTLPESTVEFEGDKTYVYLLTSADGAEEQTFDKHEVKIGLSDGINIELTEGVTAESKVRGAREEKKK